MCGIGDTVVRRKMARDRTGIFMTGVSNLRVASERADGHVGL